MNNNQERNTLLSNPKYYILDTSKKYKAEGQTFSGGLFLIIFAVCFFGFITFCIMIDATTSNLTTMIIPFIFIAIFSSVFFIAGVYLRKKAEKISKSARGIISRGTLTVGVVSNTNTVRKSTGKSTYYEATVDYEFIDRMGYLRYGSFKGTYSLEPKFRIGLPLMVAFDNSGSCVMKYFTLKNEGEFLKDEASRPLDLEGIDGSLVELDQSKTFRNAECSLTNTIGGYIVCGLYFLVFFPLLTIFTIVLILSNGFPIWIFLIILNIVLFLTMGLVGVYLLRREKSKKKALTEIMLCRPSFTIGKIITDRKTYRGSFEKKYDYFYYDERGQIQSGQIDSAYNNQNPFVLVAYTATKKSLVIFPFSLQYPEQDPNLFYESLGITNEDNQF